MGVLFIPYTHVLYNIRNGSYTVRAVFYNTIRYTPVRKIYQITVFTCSPILLLKQTRLNVLTKNGRRHNGFCLLTGVTNAWITKNKCSRIIPQKKTTTMVLAKGQIVLADEDD